MDIITLDEPISAPAPTEPLPQTIPAFQLYPSLDTRPKEAEVSAPPPQTAPEGAVAAAEPLVSVSAPPPRSELDVKVAEAVEQMRSMGFHDDGRSLC